MTRMMYIKTVVRLCTGISQNHHLCLLTLPFRTGRYLFFQRWTRARSECLPGGGKNYSYATGQTSTHYGTSKRNFTQGIQRPKATVLSGRWTDIRTELLAVTEPCTMQIENYPVKQENSILWKPISSCTRNQVRFG